LTVPVLFLYLCQPSSRL